MNNLPSPDSSYLTSILKELLLTSSPTGHTDRIVPVVSEELQKIGFDFELTRRGAIRVHLNGETSSPSKALVAHLDTIGAMVKGWKSNGRLEIVPIGTWSSRFAEGARVTVITESRNFRGTILPLKSSGHAYDKEIDMQPVTWDSIELRLDEELHSEGERRAINIHPGDFIAIDPQPEFLESGYLVSRHLDGKCGAAILLTLAKTIAEQKITPVVDVNLLFTITEEVGSGASSILHGDIAEMVTLDMAPLAENQNGSEFGATLVFKDGSGPFDYHLTQKLLRICEERGIEYSRDVLTHYFCDSASAIEAGNDIRTALVGYGVDASHGYERTHVRSLEAVSELTLAYLLSPPAVRRDKKELAPLAGFPTQPE